METATRCAIADACIVQQHKLQIGMNPHIISASILGRTWKCTLNIPAGTPINSQVHQTGREPQPPTWPAT